jgi:hypothetical protein
MRKGFFASVAALAAGAGVALGQGFPSAPPGSGNWQGAGSAPPAGGQAGSSFYAPGPAGNSAGPGELPPAAEMPAYGQVDGPHSGHPLNPGAQPKYGMQVGQVHKAAGGPDRWFFDIEDMVWAVRSMPLPYPLLTVSPATISGVPVNPATSAGVVGQPGTQVLVGDNIDYGNAIQAGRLTIGVWDQARVYGYELSGFVTEGKSEIHTFGQTAISKFALARPVIDALTMQPTSFLISFPGAFGGTGEVKARFHMGGAEANVLKNLIYCDQVKLNALLGIRYINLEERLNISSTTVIPTSDPNDPTLSYVLDQFLTRNQFVGGQIGFQSELRRGRFFIDTIGKLAAGNMNQHLNILGQTTRTVTGVTTTIPAGLLAVSSNFGTHSYNDFAYVPEATVKFGYQWTQRISTYVGGNALYLSRVLRPGDQIDPVVNPTLVPVSDRFGADFGPNRPQVTNNHADFWAMGVTFGLTIRY